MTTLSTGIKQVGVGALAGIPIGAGILRAKRWVSPPGVLDLVEDYAEMPLAQGITRQGTTERAFKEAPMDTTGIKGLLNRIRGTEKSPEKKAPATEKKSSITNPSIMQLLGVGAGIGVGYKGTEALMDHSRTSTLREALAARKKQLSQALMDEQRVAMSGVKKASVNIPAAAKQTGTFLGPVRGLASELAAKYETLDPAMKLLYGVTGGAGAAAAVSRAYSRTSAADQNRTMKKSLKTALRQRLQMGEAGSRDMSEAPAIIQLLPTRAGLTPLRPGASALVSPGSGRDIFSF